jgi:hypothetical protein
VGRGPTYRRHQLYVVLAGGLEKTEPVMRGLDRAIHDHDGAHFDPGPVPDAALEQHWSFTGKTDALHAAEVARALLKETAAGMRWQLWLFSAGEMLLSQTCRCP